MHVKVEMHENENMFNLVAIITLHPPSRKSQLTVAMLCGAKLRSYRPAKIFLDRKTRVCS